MSDCASSTLMRIGALADKAGRTQRTLHFYEELGLLTPVGRTKGGFRLYDQDSLVRIHWITRLQDLGFSLPEIREFLVALRSAQSAPEMMQSLQAFYAQKRIDTQAQLTRLQSLDEELVTALDYLSGCHTCAPATEKSACSGCDTGDHADTVAPPLVAGVHDHPSSSLDV